MSCVSWFCDTPNCDSHFSVKPKVCDKCGSKKMIAEFDEQDDHHPDPPEPEYDDDDWGDDDD